MRAYRLFYILKTTKQNIQDHGPTLVISITAVGFTLLLFASYVLLSTNLQSMGKRMGEHLQITMYLEKNLAEKEIPILQSRVAGMEQVDSVTYCSPEEALDSLRKSLGESAGVLSSLSENPLPASFQVTLGKDHRDLESMRGFSGQLRTLKGVREVDYGGGWIERFFGFVKIVRWLGASLGFLLLAATVIVISSTLSLGFYARKEEIEILRLVGASESYIRFPFFWEAMLQGMGGAGVALGILWALYHIFRLNVLEAWSMFGGWIQFHFLSPVAILGIILLGAFVGGLSCIVSFSRFSPRP